MSGSILRKITWICFYSTFSFKLLHKLLVLNITQKKYFGCVCAFRLHISLGATSKGILTQ